MCSLGGGGDGGKGRGRGSVTAAFTAWLLYGGQGLLYVFIQRECELSAVPGCGVHECRAHLLPWPSPARAGKVLFDTVGDWHFDKRDHDPTPVPRGLKQPASTVHFPLGRELIRCVWGWRRVREGGRGRCGSQQPGPPFLQLSLSSS